MKVKIDGEMKDVATYKVAPQTPDPDPTPTPEPDPTPTPEPEPAPSIEDDDNTKTLEAVIAVLSVVSAVGIATSISVGVMSRKKSKKED